MLLMLDTGRKVCMVCTNNNDDEFTQWKATLSNNK